MTTTADSPATAGRSQLTAPAPAAVPEAGRATLPVILAGVFMAALDFFIVNVAIPSTQQDLRASTTAIEWIVAGYGLAYGVGLTTAGRLGDPYGRRRMFRLGLVAFTLASLACGLAPSPGTLIAARVAQGVAAAIMTPQVLAIVRTTYAGARQARAFSAYGLTMGVAAVSGQLIGGLLIQADLLGLGWRACFLINVPVGAVAVALVRRVVPESRAAGPVRLDPVGMAVLTTALVAVILPLVQGREQGWPAWTWLSFAGAAVLFVAFGANQRRRAAGGKAPLVHPALFRERAFTVGLATQLVFWLGQASFFLVLALYVQQGRGLSALQAGLLFTAIGSGYLVTSTTAHRLTARLGRQTIALGVVTMAAGLGLLAVAVAYGGTGRNVLWLAPALVIDGLGMGMAVAPLAATILSRVAPQHAGAAGGVLATAQQVGNALGVAVIGIVFYAALGDGAGRSYPAAFSHSIGYLIAVEITLAILVQLLPRARRQ
jgi:EmrB/QacA subfamily drug resistance transporter